jgi:hypothetical protein
LPGQSLVGISAPPTAPASAQTPLPTAATAPTRAASKLSASVLLPQLVQGAQHAIATQTAAIASAWAQGSQLPPQVTAPVKPHSGEACFNVTDGRAAEDPKATTASSSIVPVGVAAWLGAHPAAGAHQAEPVTAQHPPSPAPGVPSVPVPQLVAVQAEGPQCTTGHPAPVDLSRDLEALQRQLITGGRSLQYTRLQDLVRIGTARGLPPFSAH